MSLQRSCLHIKGEGANCVLFAKRANSNWYYENSPNWAIPYFRGGRLWI